MIKTRDFDQNLGLFVVKPHFFPRIPGRLAPGDCVEHSGASGGVIINHIFFVMSCLESTDYRIVCNKLYGSADYHGTVESL